MEELKRKRGRPCVGVSRKRGYRVTLSDEEFDSIGRLSRITGKTKADIFREAYTLYEKVELAKRSGAGISDGDDGVYDDFYEDWDDSEDEDEMN